MMNSESYFFVCGSMAFLTLIMCLVMIVAYTYIGGITEGCHVAMTTKIGVPVLSGNPTHFKGSPLTTRTKMQ